MRRQQGAGGGARGERAPALPCCCCCLHSCTPRCRRRPCPARLPPEAFGLTLVWALVAIYEKTDSALVSRAALAAIVLLAILSMASVLRRPGAEPARQHDSDSAREAREPLRPSLDGP